MRLMGLACTTLALLIGAPASPAESQTTKAPREDRPGADSDYASNATEGKAKTPEEADREFYGEADGSVEKTPHTSHFNFDNRVFPSDPNPPRTDKVRCFIECVLDDGRTRYYRGDDPNLLRRIPVGDWRTLDINNKNVRVVKCRFWWKLRPLGPQYHSSWIEADDGYYIVYVFLIWHGNNEYAIESLTQEPIAKAPTAKK